MKAGLSLFIAAVLVVTGCLPALAGPPVCSSDTETRIAVLRAILGEPQESLMTQRDREALYCLIETVASLDAKLRGLSSGTIPFDGQIHIPHGYVITKPPAEEAH